MVFSTYGDGRALRRQRGKLGLTARLLAVTVLVAAALGCGKEPAPERRAPPPPPKQPTTCAGEKRINDPANLKYFPDKTGALRLMKPQPFLSIIRIIH